MNTQPFKFSGSSKHYSRFNLLTMLGLAAFLHLLGWLLFKTAALPSKPSPLSPATFYVPSPDSSNSASLNSWLEAEDPSLFMQTTSPQQSKIRFSDF